MPLFLFSQTVFNVQSDDAAIKVEKLASNIGIAWGMTMIENDQLLISLKEGKFILLNTHDKTITEFETKPDVFVIGQGGLLDVQVSPLFKEDKTLFFTYVKRVNNQGATTLAKMQLINNKLTNMEDILVTKSLSDTSRHFGSRIAFDDKGHVFFSVGDRGVRPNGQDLTTHAGSIIRLNLNGTIPKDNPFVQQNNALDEIYSYGHRNPQGLFYDKNTQQLFSGEHGPRGGDEINIIQKANNYGWSVISYGKEYWNPFPVGEGTHKEGMEQPIKVFTPSIAAGSLIVYDNATLKAFHGNIFQGALKLTHLNRIVLNKNGEVVKEERLLQQLNERIRNVIQNKKGQLLLSTDSGNIYRLTFKAK
jgi:glucose/arabinose dehydrogenase